MHCHRKTRPTRDDLRGLSEPALVATLEREGDAVDDGLFTATEIADFALSARFVVLSACDTANFDLSEAARDLPALATAFALAGAPSTLGTLWPVESGTSRIMMSDLFAQITASLDPVGALARLSAPTCGRRPQPPTGIRGSVPRS